METRGHSRGGGGARPTSPRSAPSASPGGGARERGLERRRWGAVVGSYQRGGGFASRGAWRDPAPAELLSGDRDRGPGHGAGWTQEGRRTGAKGPRKVAPPYKQRRCREGVFTLGAKCQRLGAWPRLNVPAGTCWPADRIRVLLGGNEKKDSRG